MWGDFSELLYVKCCARGVALGRLSIKRGQTWTPVEAWGAQVRRFHGPNTRSSTQVPLVQLPTPAAHAPLPRPHSWPPPAGTPADSAATAREPPVSASAAPPAEPQLRGAPTPAPAEEPGEPLPGDARGGGGLQVASGEAAGCEGPAPGYISKSSGGGCVGHGQGQARRGCSGNICGMKE